MTALGILWFVLLAVLICGYFVLDGFDLGCGVLYPLIAKDERERAFVRRAIGPVWDGNEVWLLTAGGAMFAAFAPAYATSFSGFYLAIMLVLFALIVRACSLEFRAHDHGAWVKVWDWMFIIGSFLPALLFGVAAGNVIEGIPLNDSGDYTGTFFQLLNPFALACGALGLVHMLLLGSSWLSLKAPADSALYGRARALRPKLAVADLVVFALVSVIFFVQVVPASAAGITATLPSCLFALLFVASAAYAAAAKGEGYGASLRAHVASSMGCAGLVGTMAASLFQSLIPSTASAYSITIADAASSDTALLAMTVIALIGVPLVLIYHVVVYRVFAGRLTDEDLKY